MSGIPINRLFNANSSCESYLQNYKPCQQQYIMQNCSVSQSPSMHLQQIIDNLQNQINESSDSNNINNNKILSEINYLNTRINNNSIGNLCLYGKVLNWNRTFNWNWNTSSEGVLDFSGINLSALSFCLLIVFSFD